MAYGILAALACVTPYILAIVLVIITGDRIAGMSYAAYPAIVLVHLLFGIFFIRPRTILKYILILFASMLCFVGVILTFRYSLVPDLNLDIYGYWEGAVSNFLVGLLVWETTYQLLSRSAKSDLED